MNRSGLLVVGAAATLALACGANPSKYLVALDPSALASLPGSCYATGAPPTPAPQTPPLQQHELTVWEGAKGVHYLEIDSVTVSFPSNPIVNFSGLAQGGPKSWIYTRTQDRPNMTTETRKMEFNFTDLSATLQGSIAVTDTFTCPAPPCGFQDCSVTLGLNGRLIEATSVY